MDKRNFRRKGRGNICGFREGDTLRKEPIVPKGMKARVVLEKIQLKRYPISLVFLSEEQLSLGLLDLPKPPRVRKIDYKWKGARHTDFKEERHEEVLME
jgi:hypothetical protein